MKKIINTFILGWIALAFTFDAIVYAISGYSISGQINSWAVEGSNIYFFWVIVIVLVGHWTLDKYKK